MNMTRFTGRSTTTMALINRGLIANFSLISLTIAQAIMKKAALAGGLASLHG